MPFLTLSGTTSAPTDFSTRLCGNSHRNLHTISEVPTLSCEDFKRGLLSVLKNVQLQRKHHRSLPHANANQPRIAHNYFSQGSPSTTASFTHWQGTRGMGLEISASAPKGMTLHRFPLPDSGTCAASPGAYSPALGLDGKAAHAIEPTNHDLRHWETPDKPPGMLRTMTAEGNDPTRAPLNPRPQTLISNP